MPLNYKGIGEYSAEVCTYKILIQMRTALILLILCILETIRKYKCTESTHSADVIRNPLKPLYFPSYHLAQSLEALGVLTGEVWY